MERMTPKDLAILELEDDISAAHGMTVGVFAGPEPRYDELLERIQERVGLVPRYRQRLVEVPLKLQRPVWVDDPNFSLDFHVRHTALPERTSRNAVSAFVSRLLSQRLDRGKPLWELWTVSGLPENRWALVSKVHYSIIDGVSGSDLLGLLADDVDIAGVPRQRMAKKLPSDSDMLRAAVSDLAFDPLESYRTARSLVNTPMRLASSIVGGVGPRRSPNGLGSAVGPHRRWQGTNLPLEQLRTARKANACSTTDVILAGFAGGVRNYLTETGRPLPRSIKALVPISVGAATAGTSGQIAALEAELPIAEPDGARRLFEISKQTSAKAEASGAVAGRYFVDRMASQRPRFSDRAFGRRCSKPVGCGDSRR